MWLVVERVEAEEDEFRGLVSGARAARAHQMRLSRAYAPDHRAVLRRLEPQQVADERARPRTPELHRAVVRRRHDEPTCQLDARERRRVPMAGRREHVQAATVVQVPHTDRLYRASHASNIRTLCRELHQ